jgi:hypothetical protein
LGRSAARVRSSGSRSSFLFSGLSQSALALPSFLAGALALTVIATRLYLGTRGSVLAASLLQR